MSNITEISKPTQWKPGHQRQLKRIGDIVGTSAPVGLGSSVIPVSFVTSFIWSGAGCDGLMSRTDAMIFF